jgi:hypothetical protein
MTNTPPYVTRRLVGAGRAELARLRGLYPNDTALQAAIRRAEARLPPLAPFVPITDQREP